MKAALERRLVTLETKIRAYQAVGIALIATVILLAASAVWSHTMLWGTQTKMARLEETVRTAERDMATLILRAEALEQTAASLPEMTRAELEAQSQAFEEQIINSGSALLKSTIALAKKDMTSFGLSGHRFNMAEFDRRSCPLGGAFSGELPNGSVQEQTVEANAMVDILETHIDIRGIPFYNVEIGGVMVEWAGQPAEYRHGSMRVECR